MNKLTAFVFKLGIPYAVNSHVGREAFEMLCRSNGKPFNIQEYNAFKKTKISQVVLFSDTIDRESSFFINNEMSLIKTETVSYDTEADLERAKDMLSTKYVETIVDIYKPKYKYSIDGNPINAKKAYLIKVNVNPDSEFYNKDNYTKTIEFDISTEDIESEVIRFEEAVQFLNRYLTIKSRYNGSEVCDRDFVFTEEQAEVLDTFDDYEDVLIFSYDSGEYDVDSYELLYRNESGQVFKMKLTNA